VFTLAVLVLWGSCKAQPRNRVKRDVNTSNYCSCWELYMPKHMQLGTPANVIWLQCSW
jgi:hypothetical protein